MKITDRVHFSLRLFIALLVVMLFQFMPGKTLAAGPEKIAIIPFKINAQQDLGFLQNGILDMLASRLSWEDRVIVIGKEETLNALAGSTGPINETDARMLGQHLKADYVVFGSLTVFGNSVSIDAKVIDVHGQKPPLAFYNQSQGMDDVIPKINLFAEDINQQLFNRVTVARRGSAAPAPSQQPDIYQHPEKLLQEGGGGAEEGERGLFLREGGRILAQKFWKSRNFDDILNGVAVGDLEGDGRLETVLITNNTLHIFRFDGNRFSEVLKLDGDSHKVYIGLDVADINHNDKAEIFITAQNIQRNRLESLVLEFNGKTYAPIVEGSRYYYRISNLPLRGKILLGQRQLLDNPFSGDIVELEWKNGDYLRQRQVKTPPKLNLLGFCLGDVMNDGNEESGVAYNTYDRIMILNAAGKVEWTDSERFGGSMQYHAGEVKVLGDVENRIYLPMRILAYKNETTNKTEIIAAKNEELTNYRLNFRKFDGCYMESFLWNGLGMESQWRTRRMSGQIRDYCIADFDQDGKQELIIAVVLKEGAIAFTEKKSTLIAYELN